MYISARIILRITLLFFIGVFITAYNNSTHAQEYVVEITEDLPDADLSDNIYAPKTLRSALENIERYGGTQIRFLNDRLTYNLTQGYQLPVINKPIKIIGKGSTIHGENYIRYGLFFESGASGSEVEDLRLTGFNICPLTIKCNNSVFTSLEIFDNLNTGILLNNASNNTFNTSKTTYSNFKVFSNGGDGIQLDPNSNGNTFDGISIGCDLVSFKIDLGNLNHGLYILGQGTIVKNCVFAYNRLNGIEIEQSTLNLNAAPTTITDCDFQINRLNSFEEVGTPGYSETNNQKTGIRIFRGSNVTIRNCIFARHRGYGIESGVAGANTLIDSNIFGLTPANRQMTDFLTKTEIIGESAIKVRGNNITISNNHIGKVKNGISVFSSSGGSIIGNKIGVVVGDSVYSPLNDGIFIGENVKNLKIGDAVVSTLGNIILGTGRHCIWAQSYDSTKLIVIANNYLGLESNNKPAVPCAGSGIFLEGNVSYTSIESNSISSLQNGIKIRTLPSPLDPKIVYTPSSHIITKNAIGFFLQDSTVKNNTEAAITLDGVKDVEVSYNMLSHSNIGIVCSSPLNTNISIFFNQIGASTSTDYSTANASHGILLKNGCTNVSVGLFNDPTSGNAFFNNGGAAVAVEDSAMRILIIYNTMIGNKLGSIKLGDGKLYYDAGRDKDSLDADSGPNSLQNAPFITKFDLSKPVATYEATLVGKPGSKCRINVYRTLILPESSQHLMSAIKHIGQFQVTIPESGVLDFSNEITDAETIGLMKKNTHTITMTATNEDLETSQLGRIIYSNDATDLGIYYDTTKSQAIGKVIQTQLVVKNNSGIKALNVKIIDSLPPLFVVDSAMSTQGVPTVGDSSVNLTLAELNANDSVIIIVYGHQLSDGVHRRIAYVYSDSKEITLANNQDSLRFFIDPTQIHQAETGLLPTYYSSGQTLIITMNSYYKEIQLLDILGNRVIKDDLYNKQSFIVSNIPFGLYLLVKTDLKNKQFIYDVIHY